MPLYAYRCRSCDHQFETLVRTDETVECPSCGAQDLEQQLSLVAKPASGGPDAAAPSCAGMSGGTPCGTGCPAFGGGM
jgi:putative FmdB family regulatory protein